MSLSNFFTIALQGAPCFKNISEDEVRELVAALVVSTDSSEGTTFVTSSGNIPVNFEFNSDGNFVGVTAKIDGKSITLIQGAGGTALELFKGAPSASNPGAGWLPDIEATTLLLNQPDDQSMWKYFYASRVSVLNTFS